MNEIQTPAFVLQPKICVEKYNEFRLLFGGEIFYTVKTNPHPSIIRALAGQGSGFEAGSFEHIEILLKSGVETEKILLYNPSFNTRDFEKARKLGIKRFVLDSIEQFEYLESKKDEEVLFRLMPKHVKNEVYPNKELGIPYNVAEEFLKRRKIGSKLGLHQHIGSQTLDFETFSKNSLELVELAQRLDIRTVNFGGGYPVKYTDSVLQLPQIFKAMSKALSKAQSLGIKTYFEPGRYIAAPCMRLVTRVKLLKGNIAFLDESVYRSYLDVIMVKISLPVAGKGEHKYSLRGKSPDSLDKFGDYSLPKLKENDMVIFENAGAYIIGSNFMGYKDSRVIIDGN